MSERVCDDVEYRYNEATEMLFIRLCNDDNYYKVPKRAAKYNFGRSPDKEDKKVKLLIGLYPRTAHLRLLYCNGEVCPHGSAAIIQGLYDPV